MRLFRKIHQKLNWSTKRYLALFGFILFLTYIASAIYQTQKSIPEGLAYTGQLLPSSVEFLADQTFVDAAGKLHSEQQIFDAILTLIHQAQSTIVIDMFLFNAETGASKLKHQALSRQLVQALIRKKQENPQIEIKLITDPINTVYGGQHSEQLRQLRQHGIDVITTDLTLLRASNPVWSGFWYMCCQGIGNNPDAAWLTNPLGQGKVTLRSYLDLLNFKANHRKTMVVDTIEGWKALISTANVHDGSSQHSNVAVLVQGKAAADILQTENVVARFSGGDTPVVILPKPTPDSASTQVQILTEGAIYQQILKSLAALKSGDQLDLLMFYLSERKVIEAIKAAKQRGVNVRIVLDPNKDAFGREKNGIPNRQVAWELHKSGIDVRWCKTSGEQCHSKMLLLSQNQHKQLLLGSANYTARNLKNYNLETDVLVKGTATDSALVEAQQYFETVWRNTPDKIMSVDYQHYQEQSRWKYWLYRFMEWSGLSTF